jgi:hypothetical protein
MVVRAVGLRNRDAGFVLVEKNARLPRGIVRQTR